MDKCVQGPMGKLKMYLLVTIWYQTGVFVILVPSTTTVFLVLCIILFAKTYALVDSYPRTDPITEPANQPRNPKFARSNPQVTAEKNIFIPHSHYYCHRHLLRQDKIFTNMLG